MRLVHSWHSHGNEISIFAHCKVRELYVVNYKVHSRIIGLEISTFPVENESVRCGLCRCESQPLC